MHGLILEYATSGKLASIHLKFELIKHRYKLDIPDVPYKSFGQAITDTISGQVSFYFAALPATPRAIISTLDAQIASALKSPEVQQRLNKGGVFPTYAPSDKFGAAVAEETAKWRKLIDELGLRSAKQHNIPLLAGSALTLLQECVAS